VAGTYGVFASGRAWDQIRTTIGYTNLNVKIAGAHGGISVGPHGATHQALEETALTNILPNMNVVLPCDSVETEKATQHALLSLVGPCYLRFAREATPIVTNAETTFEFGTAKVIRYRGNQPKFLDAFDTILGPRYHSEHEQLAIIACGPMVPEAMRAVGSCERSMASEGGQRRWRTGDCSPLAMWRQSSYQRIRQGPPSP
jgi:transketolase